MFVFCRKWFGCLCANSEYDSSSSPAGKLTLSPEGQSQLSLASPRIRAPARIPAAATAAVGHADSAHSLNHHRRVTATHKEGHDAVISWLEKADIPSPDDDVAPVRKVCYYFLYDEASPPHTNISGPHCACTCLLQVEISSRCQHITACHSLSSASQMEAAYRYYEMITSAAVQRAKEDQRRRSPIH